MQDWKDSSKRWNGGGLRTQAVVVFLCTALVAVSWLGHPSLARDWPSWRGPEQNGVSRETDLPETWSPAAGGENLVWSAPYGARSAPVVLNERLYILNLSGEGKHQQERVMCFDAETGKVLWEHRFNLFLTDIASARVGWSNPTADPETGYVYVHGVQGLLKCLDRDGKVVWQRSLTEELGRISGYGGRTHTPVIDEDRLIISFLNSSWGPQGKGGHRYLALDKRTGTIIWWSEPGGRPLDTTYSTPIVTVVDGVRLLIGGNADGGIYAMKARTGEKVWGFRLTDKRGINSSVVERKGLVYACHSEDNIDEATMGRLVCIDARGKGDVTKTHEKWRLNRLTAGYSSPALDGNDLYVVDNSANVHCVDALTGKRRWQANVGRAMKGSPVVGDGKIYIGAVGGFFSILRPGRDGCDVLSRTAFSTPDGRVTEINGSPCIANGRVYFTTQKAIYCLGKKPWGGQSRPLPELPREAKVDRSAAPGHLQVTPGEVALQPGQKATLQARLFDAGGRFLRECSPTWSLRGLEAELSPRGEVTIPSGSWYQGGAVTARFGGLEAEARVRVVPALPIRVDFENIPVGQVPPGWVGASPVKFQVAEHGGSKVLKKLAQNPRFIQSYVYLGLPQWKGYTVQADVMATEKRRQLPDIGIVANRYRLALMGNVQRARIVSWAPMPRIEEKVKFAWKPDVWYRMKLHIDSRENEAVARGKVWPREEPEPEEWTVEAVDPQPNWNGSPGLHGYSAGTTDRFPGADIFFDNIVISRSE